MILIIENDPEVPAGILKPLLTDDGLQFTILRAHSENPSGDLSRLTGLVVLGGAMSTSDDERFPFLLDVKAFMKAAVVRGIPVLGICLGGQLLAEVAGGEVTRESHGERGLQEILLTQEGRRDPLFRGLPECFTVFQWHNDSFVPPENAVLLAGSPICAHQAFRIGKHAYGIQFHPEVDERIVSSWAAGSSASVEIQAAFHSYRQEGLDTTPCRFLKNFIRMTTQGQTPP